MTDVPTQRAAALKLANETRIRNAQYKRHLKSGELRLADALEEPELQDWPIGDLVGFACIGLPRWSGTRQPLPAAKQAQDLLEQLGISHWRPLRQVTPRERGRLLAAGDQMATKRLAHRLSRLRQQANKTLPA